MSIGVMIKVRSTTMDLRSFRLEATTPHVVES